MADRSITWARSATKHRVRLVYLGDDAAGDALEVVAIEVEGDGLLVIHAMTLRARYRASYEEATRWRI